MITLATLCLVLPTFTTSRPGPEFSPAQLAFAASASLALYGLFVLVQTVRHRDYFLPVRDARPTPTCTRAPPSARAALQSLGLLLVALVAVVGLAKTESPAIEDGVDAAGASRSRRSASSSRCSSSLPETLAAVRAARRDRVQTSLNLALGSAMASIGLTIPAIAVASIWLEGPLILGLGATQMVLLAITAGVVRAHGGPRARDAAAGRPAPGALRRLPVPRGPSLGPTSAPVLTVPAALLARRRA